MKKVLCFFMAFGLCFGLTGCGSNEDKKEETKTEVKESDLDKVSKIFTFDTSEANGTKTGIAKEGDTIKFKIYITIGDQEKQMAEALKVTPGYMLYFVDGLDTEVYQIENNLVYLSSTKATGDSMKANMDAYLSEKGITFDQLKNAMKEKFGV